MLKPGIAFHPGEYLADALEMKGWSQTQFAELIDIGRHEINDLIKGRRNMTPRIASRISKALATSCTVWLNLQNIYDLYRIDKNKEEIRQKEIKITRVQELAYA